MTQTEQYLIDKYQMLTLPSEVLAQELHYENAKAVLNAVSAGRFPVKTYKIGKHRVADVRDVAAYLDEQRDSAA